MLGQPIGYRVLKRMAPRVATTSHSAGTAPSPSQQLLAHFGPGFFEAIAGRTVIDFGCGEGHETVEMAKQGAARVIGLDIQPRLLAIARAVARQAGMQERVEFADRTSVLADVIVSKDAFEHFSDPAAILRQMLTMLKPDGKVLAAFGPTWLHPYGGHLFSVFPWAHLVFSERALLRWRADHKSDGATRFAEVEGGLNQMTIGRFQRTVRLSGFRIERLETVPIRGIRLLRAPILREFGSSIVRATLRPN